ncbi:DUF4407 domain-containing protein [Bacteroidales bacterium]|nr:DUF4407 domain-containing protein [Bacteroidales bacterium]
MAEESKDHKLGILYRFFCWCSGARLYLLRQCPIEYNKYFGIGITIFLTGMLAAISGGYAVYYVFNDIITSAAFGLFWGTLIFFIDWYLVASLRKENKPWKEVASSIPRVILALLLATVIAYPLKMKLFESEIDNELIVLQTDKNINQKNKIFEEFDLIKTLQEENEKLQLQINEKSVYRQQLYESVITEAEGRSATSAVGKGPVYREKVKEFEMADKMHQDIYKRNNQKISDNEKRINELQTQRDVSIQTNAAHMKRYNGLLARFEALNSLANRNKHIKLMSMFILILFMTIESLPVVVKLISKRGPYDQLFELIEGKQSLKFKKELYEHKDNLQGELYENMEKSKELREQRIENNKLFYKELMKQQLEMRLSKIEKWVDKKKKEPNIDMNDVDPDYFI